MNQNCAPPRTGEETRVPSPCIGVCALDPGTGLCSGCLRSAREIAIWRDADDPTRLAILDRIRIRIEQGGSIVAGDRSGSASA